MLFFCAFNTEKCAKLINNSQNPTNCGDGEASEANAQPNPSLRVGVEIVLSREAGLGEQPFA